MAMNARNPATSDQLASILGFLTARREVGATTAEISDRCGTLNVATCVSELRQAGYVVTCKFEGKNQAGRKVYRYHVI